MVRCKCKTCSTGEFIFIEGESSALDFTEVESFPWHSGFLTAKPALSLIIYPHLYCHEDTKPLRQFTFLRSNKTDKPG
jgi:hypothetical protein